MATSLTLLHTAEVHRDTFARLSARITPGLRLIQHVREDWLLKAGAEEADADFQGDVAALIARSADGPVMCTCTTLGPMAEVLGALRIDRPMMAQAARIGGEIAMVYALKSTLAPSLALLQSSIATANSDATVTPLALTEFWPLFEACESAAFHACIAAAVKAHLAEHPDTRCVVLAQASMAGAGVLLTEIGVPVLTSPDIALRTAQAL